MEAKNKGLVFSVEHKSIIPTPRIDTAPISDGKISLSEKLACKSLALVKLSFEFHSREITSSKAKIFLKTLNNARSILKTHLKKHFLSPEKSSLTPKTEIQKVAEILSLIRDAKLELEEKYVHESKNLVNEISNRDSIIVQKDREISDLKERLEERNRDVEFWKKKFAQSLPLACNNPATNSETTSFIASYNWKTYEPSPESGFYYGDICSSPPFKNYEISLLELRINDYKRLNNKAEHTDNVASSQLRQKRRLTHLRLALTKRGA